jgi:hypothetical protein
MTLIKLIYSYGEGDKIKPLSCRYYNCYKNKRAIHGCNVVRMLLDSLKNDHI